MNEKPLPFEDNLPTGSKAAEVPYKMKVWLSAETYIDRGTYVTANFAAAPQVVCSSEHLQDINKEAILWAGWYEPCENGKDRYESTLISYSHSFVASGP